MRNMIIEREKGPTQEDLLREREKFAKQVSSLERRIEQLQEENESLKAHFSVCIKHGNHTLMYFISSFIHQLHVRVMVQQFGSIRTLRWRTDNPYCKWNYHCWCTQSLRWCTLRILPLIDWCMVFSIPEMFNISLHASTPLEKERIDDPPFWYWCLSPFQHRRW